jgi:2-polyprenyl-3-methyl-5-hydroxy-6-metoxy-1,4-benzoquinol methylase
LGGVKAELAGFVDGVPERCVPDIMRGELVDAEHRVRYWWVGHLVKGRRVLDAGCGTGYGSTILAESGADEVVGIDVAENVLEAARARAPVGVHFEVGDVRTLPFEDASFDAVVSFEVIEHVAEHDVVLDEFARVLRPGGILAVSSPNRYTYPIGNPHHVRELVPDELHEYLGKHFQHVRLFRQADWITSALLNDASFEARNGAPRADVTMRKIAGREPGSETYTVALASNAPLEDPPELAVLTEPVELRRLAELEGLVADRNLLFERFAEAEQMLADRHELARYAVELRTRVHELEGELVRCQGELVRLDAVRVEAQEARHHAEMAEIALQDVVSSLSWRLTTPLRAAKRLIRGARGSSGQV